MFDDDNDEEVDAMSEFERWFDDHLFYFPPELRVSGYEDLEIEIFYRKVYCNVKRELSAPIRKLMGVQYPNICLLYTSPSPRDGLLSRMPSSA